MLLEVNTISNAAVDRLFTLYADSMNDLQKHFSSFEEMKQAYLQFLTEFASSPQQLILVEEIQEEWVSGLRAIEVSPGNWFLEAVETKPNRRRCGYGKMLLLHTIAYLKDLGMQQITCQISKTNQKSQNLHAGCGFLPTQEPSVDPWGNTDEHTILYRYRHRSLVYSGKA